MKLDILAFAAHPDDTELACSGTLALQISKGNKVGVVDITEGELGTRGSVAIRKQEAAKSAEILGLSIRENLGLPDGFFENNKANQLKVVRKIRQFQPEIILANAIEDRHPDHGRAARLLNDSVFLSGLKEVKTFDDKGNEQIAWRPGALYHYIQSKYIKPDFVVDVSETWDMKMASIRAFESQFHNPKASKDEPETFISNPKFLEFVIARGREYGMHINAAYGEGFTTGKLIGIDDLFVLK